MKIYKCIAKTRDEALSEAIRKYGIDIQIAYEREFLYGLFNRKWIELGFFLKDAEDYEVKSRFVSSDYLNAAFASNRISKLLSENDFSSEIIERLIGKYYSDASENGNLASLSAISDFLSVEIAGMARSVSFFQNTMRMASGLPRHIVLLSPFDYDRGGFLSHLVSVLKSDDARSDYSGGNRFVIANLDRNDACASDGVGVRNISGLDELQSLYDGLNGERLIVNVGCSRYFDVRYADEVAEVLGATSGDSALLLMPSCVKSSKIASLIGARRFFGVAWLSLSRDDTIGNIISSSYVSGLKSIFMDCEEGIVKCDDRSLLRHIKGGLSEILNMA